MRNIFDHTLYIRTSSSESIIKAIRLNQVGTISSVYLYNGVTLNLNDLSNQLIKKTYEDFFYASFDEGAKEYLVHTYNDRLSVRALKDYSQEAEDLANKHIKEIKSSLSTEKIELLAEDNDTTISAQIKRWENIKKTTYPHWIDWLLELALLTLFVFTIFAFDTYKTWKKYKRLQSRLNEVTNKFPNALSKHNIPVTLEETIGQEIEQIINRNFSIWEKEEQEIIRQKEQMRIVTQNVLRLKNLYPNGWNKAQKSHPNYSDAEMISIENEIASEEEMFQQAKEAARLAELERVKKEKETIKRNLQLLSQATQVGNIELAEESFLLKGLSFFLIDVVRLHAEAT